LSRIFWDTNIFIYLLEGAGEPFQLARGLLDRMVERRDELRTSTLTLGEVLVRPIEARQPDTANKYGHFLTTTGVQLVPFDRDAARIYAGLRQDRTIRAPDAIQLSCAASVGTSLFVTIDAG